MKDFYAQYEGLIKKEKNFIEDNFSSIGCWGKHWVKDAHCSSQSRSRGGKLRQSWADISCPEAILRARRHLDRRTLSIGLELHTAAKTETVHQRCPPSLEQLFSGNMVQKHRNQ